MKAENGVVARNREGFVIPDHEGVLQYHDLVQVINPDGSSGATFVVDTTEVGGIPGQDGFIKYVNVKNTKTGAESKIYPGQRVKWLGEDVPVEIID